MKAIIFASATAGKTTIVRYLHQHTKLPVLEIEDEFLRLHGAYPLDVNDRIPIIRRTFEDVLTRDSVIFFCNVSFLDIKDIQRARGYGFKIVQLDINLETMLERNKKRVMEEKYPDTSRYFPGMIEYQQRLRDSHLVDIVVNANQPTEQVVQDLLGALKLP